MGKSKDHKSKDHKHKKVKDHKNSTVSEIGEATDAQLTPVPPSEPEQDARAQPNANEEDISESDSESDQVEDDYGDLVTPEIDQGIDRVLTALRSNPKELLDSKLKFFPEVGAEGTAEAREPEQREKPVFLKDYQRENLLSGAALDDNDNEQQPSPPPATYASQQEKDRADILKEINAQDDADDGDDDLLQKRTTERELPAVELPELPDPEKDADGFLSAYLSNKAWIQPPKDEKKPTYGEVVGDENENEDDDEFDDLSEKFESAYNFRFEDPTSAEIVSYARDQSTLRRGKLSSRQKKREREKAEREKQKEQSKLEMAKLRKAKVSEISNKLAQLQEAVGEDDAALADKLNAEDLDGDWDQDEWDKRMQKLFDEDFYGRSGANVDDLGEEVANELEEAGKLSQYDENKETSVDKPAPPHKLSRKELKRKAEQFVDENEDLLIEETIKPQPGFRYREVEPESFGLSARDILLASDKELNQYVGLKKLASYREKERVEKDRKRYAKRKRLREWRKSVFGTEDVPDDELWEQRKQAAASEVEAPQAPSHKPKKRKHKN